MSRTTESLRRRMSWTRPRAIARAWMRGIATAVLLTLMTPSPGAASERVLEDVLSEDAETVEKALRELWAALYGPMDRPWTVASVGAFFREDVDIASWFGKVLERPRPEALQLRNFHGKTAREVVSDVVLDSLIRLPIPDSIEFRPRNHGSAKEMFKDWPADIVDGIPTMEHLREDYGLLAELSDNVEDEEARRLALVFANQVKRVQAALPRLVEDEYDRRQRSGTIGSDGVLGGLLGLVARLQLLGTEETREAVWRTLVKEREARGLPAKVVGVEAPWNLLTARIMGLELGESDFPLEGRALSPGVRRVALALTEDPALVDRLAKGEAYSLEEALLVEDAVRLLANERPLAEETGRRILGLYCGSLDGSLDGLCFVKLNLLYSGPDDPSLQSMEADVGGLVMGSLVGLVEEIERKCGVLPELEAEVSPAAGGHSDPGQETRSRIESIGWQLHSVLALVGLLDSVPRSVLDGVFEFWSKERIPEARLILEENDWLEPDVSAVSSEQREEFRADLFPRRSIGGTTELCEGRI